MENQENHTTAEVVKVENVESTALYLLNKAEIDSQIATAHAFPRSLQRFKQMATEMATLDAETAGSCIYRRPVGKDANGKQTFAEGKSIRMAEIVGASYGNLRVGATIIEQTPRQVIARGYAHDLETNFAATSECVESTVKKNGQPYDERMRIVVAKVALAKARRDATFMVVPGAMCKSIELAARETALGKGQTMEQRRKNAMDWIGKLAIDSKRVWKALGVNGIEDCGIDELTTLKGVATAIRDNEISIDEAFPSDKPEPATIDKEAERIEQMVNDALSGTVKYSKEELQKLLVHIKPEQMNLYNQRLAELTPSHAAKTYGEAVKMYNEQFPASASEIPIPEDDLNNISIGLSTCEKKKDVDMMLNSWSEYATHPTLLAMMEKRRGELKK